MKKLLFLLALTLVIGLTLGAVVVASEKAQKDEIRVFNNLEKNKNTNGPKFIQDEIIVKFKNDNKPFRVLKVPYGQVKERGNHLWGKSPFIWILRQRKKCII